MTAGLSVLFSSLLSLAIGASLVFSLVALFCVTYAQVIWAQVAVAIAMLLGPVFIPFLLLDPLAFLFWGWFRTLMVYTLYGVVAGAILRVFMGVGLGYITTYADALMGTGNADPAELWLWAVVLLPLVVSGLMAGLKVGDLAAMLVSGSGSVGSGFIAVAGSGASAASGGPRQDTRCRAPEAQGRSDDETRDRMPAASTPRSGARRSPRTGSCGRSWCSCPRASSSAYVVLLWIASAEPPRPIVVRVDEVGRAEALAYEAATAQADPLDPTTKYFLNRFVYDFHSRRRATVEEQWTRSLRFLSTALANAAFQRDAGEVAAMAAGTAETELEVEQVVLRIHPAPEPPHGATADFDLVHLRGEQEIRRERWSLTLRFEFLERIPPEAVIHNPMGLLITYLQADRALVTEQLIGDRSISDGREQALEAFDWTGPQGRVDRARVPTQRSVHASAGDPVP